MEFRGFLDTTKICQVLGEARSGCALRLLIMFGTYVSSFGRPIRGIGRAINRVGQLLQGANAPVDELNTASRFTVLGAKRPVVGSGTFVAPDASVIGNVKLAKDSFVGGGSVLRGDVNDIFVGANSVIEEGCVLHGAKLGRAHFDSPVRVGSNVFVGKRAVLHACTVEDNAIIGDGAIVLDGAVVKSGAFVAPGATVLRGTEVASGRVYAGLPAKARGAVDAKDVAKYEARREAAQSVAKSYRMSGAVVKPDDLEDE